ncbi:PTS glucose transporter subunit IIA [Soehngenia saccharolytica]|nr:PTS glucose transporter subunit IIA [Soehngenia saccharolytica]
MFDIFKRNTSGEIIIKSPITGEIIGINEVPDKVFSGKLVGDGIGILPQDSYVYSPVNGEIVQIAPQKYAIGFRTKENVEILIHLGIDTVKLKGKGFEVYASKNQRIKTGDKLIKVDWDFVSENAKSIISPIVITNMEAIKELKIIPDGRVNAGDDLFSIILNN